MRNANQRADFIPLYAQKGVIVSMTGGPHGSAVVYAPLSGKAFLNPFLMTREMKMGSFVTYNASRFPEQNEWTINAIQYLGEELEIVPYLLGPKLQLRLNAMVNRVDKSTRQSWLWNDDIGRIRIPPLYFRKHLKPIGIIDLIVMWDGENEDVPWQAVNILDVVNGGNIENVGKLLETTDGWKVTSSTKHNKPTKGYYTLLKKEDPNGGELTAFAAWTDYSRGKAPPPDGTECKMTWFVQNRPNKLANRAIFVVPLVNFDNRPPPNTVNASILPNNHSDQPTASPQVAPLNISISPTDSLPPSTPTDSLPPSSVSSPTSSNGIRPRSSRSIGSTYSDQSARSSISEMEQLMEECSVDDFRPRANSVASVTSPLSSSFTTLFIDRDFAAWHPTEEEIRASSSSN